MNLDSSTLYYLYTFNYEYHHSDLCKLESRQIFQKEEKNKLLFSEKKIDPTISSFIKNRFEMLYKASSFSELLNIIRSKKIQIEGFKVEYMIIHSDLTDYDERRRKLKEIGFCIEGIPNFESPTITYSLCTYNNTWYFGLLTKQDNDFRKHKRKPHSFSNSIDLNIAKTLVSLASKGNRSSILLDACCGVGTVLLEGGIAGFHLEGCDINENSCNYARKNLEHFNYTAEVHCSDIKDISQKYDAIIVDLPYNLYSYSNDSITLNIIKSVSKLTSRVILVSISNIESIISQTGLVISDFCAVEKRGRSKFARNIWVCEKK